MTRMTGPDCVVMCNLINTHTHIHTHTYTPLFVGLGSCVCVKSLDIFYCDEIQCFGGSIVRIFTSIVTIKNKNKGRWTESGIYPDVS